MNKYADLIECMDDLYLQATQERSHYYTGRVVSDAASALRDLVRERDALLNPRDKPAECAIECPPNQVCDWCAFPRSLIRERDALKAENERLRGEAIGALSFGFTRACLLLDEDSDPRHYEIPRLLEEWTAALAAAKEGRK